MWSNDLDLAKEYNRRLVEISRQERQLEELRREHRGMQLAFHRYMMLRMGDSLISVGQRLRRAGEIHQVVEVRQAVELSRECA